MSKEELSSKELELKEKTQKEISSFLQGILSVLLLFPANIYCYHLIVTKSTLTYPIWVFGLEFLAGLYYLLPSSTKAIINTKIGLK